MTGRFRWVSPFDHLDAPRLDVIRSPPELPPFFPVVFPRMCGAGGPFKSWSFTSRRHGANAVRPVTETRVLTIRLSYLSIEGAGPEYLSQHLVRAGPGTPVVCGGLLYLWVAFWGVFVFP